MKLVKFFKFTVENSNSSRVTVFFSLECIAILGVEHPPFSGRTEGGPGKSCGFYGVGGPSRENHRALHLNAF